MRSAPLPSICSSVHCTPTSTKSSTDSPRASIASTSVSLTPSTQDMVRTRRAVQSQKIDGAETRGIVPYSSRKRSQLRPSWT